MRTRTRFPTALSTTWASWTTTAKSSSIWSTASCGTPTKVLTHRRKVDSTNIVDEVWCSERCRRWFNDKTTWWGRPTEASLTDVTIFSARSGSEAWQAASRECFHKKKLSPFFKGKKCQFRMVPTVWASLFAFFRDGRNLSFCTCNWLLSTQLF